MISKLKLKNFLLDIQYLCEKTKEIKKKNNDPIGEYAESFVLEIIDKIFEKIEEGSLEE